MKRTNEEQEEYEQMTTDAQYNYDWIADKDSKLKHEDIMDFLLGMKECKIFKSDR